MFRCYLLSNHFTLITDSKPIMFVNMQPRLSRRQARWSNYFQYAHFTWAHKLTLRVGTLAPSAILAVTTRKRNRAVEVAKPAAAPMPLKRVQRAGSRQNTTADSAGTATADSLDIVSRIAQASAEGSVFTDEKHTNKCSLIDKLCWDCEQDVPNNGRHGPDFQ